jgi:AraC-like DNA-binding protein
MSAAEELSDVTPVLPALHDVYFHNQQRPRAGIQVLTLEALFKRTLNHSLETPQRIHFYLIMLLTRGEPIHSVDFTDYAGDANTLLLISPGQVQQFHMNSSTRGFLVLFTPEFLYRNATELDLFHSLHVFEYSLFSPYIRLSTEERRLLHHLCGILQHEYQKPADGFSEDILRHLLRVMLLHIERIRKTSDMSKRVAPHYQEFVSFRKLVDRDLAQSRSVQHYARQLSVSPKKLNELTRTILGTTAKDFIEDRVILETQRLLAQGSLSIKEISHRMGFTDPTNLVKFFKRHTGTSPAAFRRQFFPTK